MATQHTLARPAEITGVGLHTGVESTLRLCPAPADRGVYFVRTDLDGEPEIPVRLGGTVKRARRTTLSAGGVDVQTTEHLLSALAGLQVDNARLELSGPEVPGMDGSALPFCQLIDSVGLTDLDLPRRVFRLRQPLAVWEGRAGLVAFPGSGLTLRYTMEYDHPRIGRQELTLELAPETYREQLAGARTFCLASEVEALQSAGLGKGATYQNTLVVGEDGVIENELRFEDEFIRHKLLDLVGDLFTLGFPLEATIWAFCSGHYHNNLLAQRISAHRLECERPTRPVTGRPMAQSWAPQLEAVGSDEERSWGRKTYSAAEPFFDGHFPDFSVVPGIMQLQAMAEAGSELKGRPVRPTEMRKVKFRRPLRPGDRLRLEAERALPEGWVRVQGWVGAELACEGELFLA